MVVGHRVRDETHQQIATEAYEKHPKRMVGEYFLTSSTPTMKVYRSAVDDNKVIVGVRGTYDRRDVAADAALAFGRLGKTSRYKDDRDNFAKILQEYSGKHITTAGHSLGGAVADRLKRDFPGAIKGGVAYNSAFDAKTLLNGGDRDITRYYAKGDPLGVIGGTHLNNVRLIDSGKRGLAAHRLDNFQTLR